MQHHMNLQTGLRGEVGVANVARSPGRRRFVSAHVGFQGRLQGEFFMAPFALERFFAGVSPQVAFLK